jgi:hypothetical protein
VICGVDEWRYNGYCWVDTYFDHENTRAETVPRYCDDARLRGLRGDPFTRGKKDSNIPQRDPRAYFLEIFYYRLYQVSQEWEQVAIKLSSSVKQYKQVRGQFSRPPCVSELRSLWAHGKARLAIVAQYVVWTERLVGPGPRANF